ncbi:Uncharacterised protein [Mycobacteroides abscessus subsp. abscessus]|nr:Uncharacterised protein [Mycobacteroides abscessus subsp. abscessus]
MSWTLGRYTEARSSDLSMLGSQWPALMLSALPAASTLLNPNEQTSTPRSDSSCRLVGALM